MNIAAMDRHITEDRINLPDMEADTAGPAIHATTATRTSVNRADNLVWSHAYKIAIRSSEL